MESIAYLLGSHDFFAPVCSLTAPDAKRLLANCRDDGFRMLGHDDASARQTLPHREALGDPASAANTARLEFGITAASCSVANAELQSLAVIRAQLAGIQDGVGEAILGVCLHIDRRQRDTRHVGSRFE